MTTFRSTILGASVALVLATGLTAGLTGCASGTSALGALVPTAAAEAPAGTQTAAAAAAVTGDIVDAAQADVLLKAGAGQRAYPMADGTFVVVTKTEPLPAAVQADMNAKTSDVVAANRDISENMNAGTAALLSDAGKSAAGTGKRIISVWGLFGYPDMDAETKVSYWTINGGPAGSGKQFSSRAEAETFVNAWLTQQDNANEYAVVYGD
ncbi:hypothetical protein [Cryobacterium shii]|uniref:Lipoprotein n=1 Tax=Cryobacterium shii TaxID=1259235 RepID=A0AAQ2HFD4_9MICO|nr:hypothetical protein [Cryobacterium shii]TFC45925.1 hypothetical protein E3O49_10460 [Cryobacterium shii]